MAALPASPWRDAVLALIVAGFGMKMGLVPFNGWMPLNYAAAPIPAAAVLSGAGVKAGVIGLIRFLPLGVPLQGWGEALAALGFVTAFYGVLLGLTQRNPKTILAYSSISQMGVIAAALGMALGAGRGFGVRRRRLLRGQSSAGEGGLVPDHRRARGARRLALAAGRSFSPPRSR